MTARARTIWTFAITSIALFMVTLDNLVVSTALPVIRRDLHATIQGLEWTVNAYTLTFAVLLLTGAALGDRFGRKRMFVIGLALFTGASAAAALAPSIEPADRRPGGSGHGRRDRDAAHPDDPLQRGSRRAARRRARRLGRHQRPRRRDGPARRRRGRRGALLAVDLLAQRSDRAPDDPARPVAPRRESRRRPRARPAGPRPRQRGPARHRLGARARQQPGLDEPADRRRPRRRPRCCSRRSSPGSCVPRRRCCRCASSGTGPSRRRTLPRCSCSSACSARSSCSPSSCRPCRATRRSRPGCGSCRGRWRRSSSPRWPVRSPTGSAAAR